MSNLFKYVFLDIIKNKIVLFYTFALLLISLSVFSISETSEKAIISLLNIELIVLPLICGVFSTIYFYNSSEFIELLVAQPLKRKTIFKSICGGLVTALSLAFLIGTGIPLLLYASDKASLLFLLTGIVLSACFTAFALLASVYTKDKAKGIGVSILMWFYFTLIYDGIILFLLFQFSSYPIENYMIALTCLNPIDLVRILVILKIDIAAIMGYTGALFKDFFGSNGGTVLSGVVLLLWAIIPASLALRKFNRKDL
ncbi:MAG: ABC transporter permease subunit [Bacteroidia bacterium]|nr:ABC transporter permease subunit [Bacteroidia bacterium]